jgi:Domain of unknown function DUF29
VSSKAKQNIRSGARALNGKKRGAPAASSNGANSRSAAVAIDTDFYAWLVTQVQAIREQRLDAIDWENVAEELDGMSRSLKLALTSHLRVMMTHLLKWTYQGNERELHLRSWRTSIVNARREIHDALEESPSLGNAETFRRLFERAYQGARPVAAAEMGLSDREMNRIFPTECPWTFAQFMADGFLPEQHGASTSR